MTEEAQHYDRGDEWLTVPQAIAYTKISRAKLYQYMSDNTLPWYHLKYSDHRRVKKSDLDKLMVPGDESIASNKDKNRL